MEINKSRIEDGIIDQVASEFVNEENLSASIRDEVNKRIDRLFKDKADAQIADAINEAIRNGFDREYCRVNSWGEKEGNKTTIRKELERLIGDYWNTKVERDGKPASYGDNKLTRAEWVMAQMVAADFKDTMKQHVVNVAAGLKDGLRDELHKTVNQLLTGVFHVKSLEDQKLKDGYSSHPTAV
jgi:hypothetical protein